MTENRWLCIARQRIENTQVSNNRESRDTSGPSDGQDQRLVTDKRRDKWQMIYGLLTINIGTIDRKRSVETYKRGRRFVKRKSRGRSDKKREKTEG